MDVTEKMLAGSWPGVTLVQVTLIAALGGLGWLVARRGGPALRGTVVLVALVGLLAVPALAVVAPVWLPLPGIAPPPLAPAPAPEVVRAPLPSPPERPAVAPVPAPKPTTGKPPATPLPQDIIDPIEEPAVPAEAPELTAVPPLLPSDATPAAEPEKPRRAVPSAASILVGVWLLGAALYSMRAMLSLAVLYGCAWMARPIRAEHWADCGQSLLDPDGRPRVALRESDAIRSPLTLGFFRPVILLPTGWRDWSPEQLRLVLAHELAHVRRRDFLAGLVAELAVCLCWFHPLVRWLAGRLRLEQEYAADAQAASVVDDAMDYVRCLARLALEQGAGRSPAPALWRRRPEILRRIDMLRRNRDALPSPMRWRTAGAVVALAALACVVVAGIGPLRAIAVGAAPADEPAPGAKAPATADAQGDPLPAGATARLGTTRWRHGSPIHYVAFGTDDKTLITAGQDNTVRLWDMTTGKEIRRFARPMPEARPPARNPTTAEEAAKLRAELEAARLRALRGGGEGFGVALSPDGKTLAVAGTTAVQLYEVGTGAELSKISTSTGLAGLLFSPDGKTLAGRLTDGGLMLWDATNGKERHQLKVPPRPENTRLVLTTLRGGNDSPGMAFTPDGKGFVAATAEFKEQNVTGRITLWSVESGKELRDLKSVENAGVSGVAVAPDGKVVAYCSNGTVHACKADTGEALFQTRLAEPASGVTFSPDGKQLAVRVSPQQVRVLDAENGKELFMVGDPPTFRAAGGGATAIVLGALGAVPELRTFAFSSDGKRIATAASGTVRVWNAATGKEMPLSDGHTGPVVSATLLPDGKTVVSWGADRTVRRWDAVTGKPLGSFLLAATTATAVSADGGTVAVSWTDGTIRLHDTNGGKELLKVKGNPRGIAALAFSLDGKQLAERGADSTIRVYDLTKGGEARPFSAQPATPPTPGTVVVAAPGRIPGAASAALVFSPDGKLLATTGAASPQVLGVGGTGRPPARSNGTINLIDVSTGKTVRKIELSVGVVGCAFSPDGRVLATENADESVSLWEVASGKERARLGQVAPPTAPTPPAVTPPAVAVRLAGGAQGADAAPTTLAFSPDGRILVGRAPDRSVRVWDVDGGKEIGRFKGHDGRIETVGFSPDGKAVVTGGADTTMLVWDAVVLRKDLPARQVAELPDGAADGLWTDLAGEDAGKAGQSVLKLTAAPKQASDFLGERLKPAAAIDQQKLDKWLTDLESERFAVRREAIENLLKAGEQAVPALQKLLASQPALETRLRVEELLDKLTGGTLTAEQLRLVRAVEALEKMGTAEAQTVLKTLAGGAAGALPTREARAALDRLGVR